VILYLGREAFNDSDCKIDGLTNETHGNSDYLKMAELFVPIFYSALLSGFDDVTVSELYITNDCILDDALNSDLCKDCNNNR
jgi:hypothetical protein